jgi:hypothetical protein
MSEEHYRICKLVLLFIFVAGSLVIGWQFTQIGWQSTQNGRYVQFDRRKDQGQRPLKRCPGKHL